MKSVNLVAYILVIIGGLNWLLVGIFGWDVGELFGGQSAIVSRIIYIVVGVAAIVKIFGCRYCSCNSCCVKKPSAPQTPTSM